MGSGQGGANRKKHGVSFESAAFALDDPLQLSVPDPHEDGNRWRTTAHIGSVCLIIVHTVPDDEAGSGRIISARRATPSERKAYEEDF